jgi:hypothetical protein
MFQGHWVHFDGIAKAFLIVTLFRH